MTKKSHRQLERERDPFYRPKPAEKPLHVGHGRHAVDAEIRPPWQTVEDKRNHPLRSELLQALLAAINARLAVRMPVIVGREGESLDVYSIFDAAGLDRRESKAWELKCAGFDIETIRIFMGVEVPKRANEEDRLSRKTVEEYLRRGRNKLRAWNVESGRF